MKQGDIVLEKNGCKAVIFEVYPENKVSLCLDGYDKYGYMAERDNLTDIADLTPTNKSIYGKQLGTCNRCDNAIYKSKDKEIDYPYYCPNCDENMYGIEVTLFDKKK